MMLFGVLAFDIPRRSSPLPMKSFLIPKENDDISVDKKGSNTHLLQSQGEGVSDHLTERASGGSLWAKS